MREQFHDLIDVEEARRRLAPLAPDVATENVPLAEAAGRVVAEPVEAGIDVPGFARAAMDGYAVRSRDVTGADEVDPVELPVVVDIQPGSVVDEALEPGQAAEISTGAVLPDGADAVVMVEHTDRDGDRVLVRRPVAAGDHVDPRGTDVGAGERVLGPGRILDARDVGTLAALGTAEVPVRKRPRVGLVSTGREVVPVDTELSPGEIHDVNLHSLQAAVRQAGGEPVPLGRVADDVDAMAEMLDRALGAADLVVTSGSTSASQVDVLYRVVADRGEKLFHGVHVKPGKPTFAGVLDGTGVLGLPGYPVSALMTFHLFAVPLVRRGLGLPPTAPSDRVVAEVAYPVRTRGGRPRLLPVGLVGTPDGLRTYPVDRGSGATTSLTDADGYAHVPGHTQRLDAGETVEVTLFSPKAPADLLGMGEHCPGMHRVLDRVEGQVKWLRTGGAEGVRRAGRGVPDVVGTDVDPPDGYDVAAAWSRRLVLVGKASRLGDLDGLPTAAWAPGTGMRQLLAEALAGEDVEPAWQGAYRSHAGAARAVMDGTVEAAAVLAAAAEEVGLEGEPWRKDRYVVAVHPDRRGKPGVARLVEVLRDDMTREAVEDLVGYRWVDPPS